MGAGIHWERMAGTDVISDIKNRNGLVHLEKGEEDAHVRLNWPSKYGILFLGDLKKRRLWKPLPLTLE
jgi:hypothetical protein